MKNIFMGGETADLKGSSMHLINSKLSVCQQPRCRRGCSFTFLYIFDYARVAAAIAATVVEMGISI